MVAYPLPMGISSISLDWVEAEKSTGSLWVLDPSIPNLWSFFASFPKINFPLHRGQVLGPCLEESNQDSELADGGERLRTEVGQAIHAPKAAHGQSGFSYPLVI